MNNILVTIVVPVYNVQNYLCRCVDSILNQTYYNLEIILVDDSSTDFSGHICDEYARQDKRIKVIHEPNNGVSSARNAGIEAATGKYICFVDSDDVVANYFVSCLLNLVLKFNAQIGIADFLRFYDSIDFSFEENATIFEYDSYTAEKLLAQNKINNAVWNKIFDINLFKNIRFPVGFIYEDLGVLYKLFYIANKIVYTNNIVYGYYYRINSIITSKFTKKNLDLLALTKERYLFFKEPELKDLFLDQYISKLENYYPLVLRNLKMKDVAKKIKKDFYVNLPIILKSKYLSLSHKFKVLFVAIVPFGFEIRLKLVGNEKL